MKRQILLKLSVLVLANISFADVVVHKNTKQIKVAIIDTGIDEMLLSKPVYCNEGHKDFTNTGLNDRHGHGTHISGIVDQYVKDVIFNYKLPSSRIDNVVVNYCQIIIKFYDVKASNQDNLENTIKAFKWAISQNVDVINYSGGGNDSSPEEKKVIIEALNKGIKIVAAAGNEHANLSKKPFYPAMYDKRIYVVGNLTQDRSPATSSNYGNEVTYWEIGTNVLSRLPNGIYGIMTGTSQATAVKTGKLIREMLK